MTRYLLRVANTTKGRPLRVYFLTTSQAELALHVMRRPRHQLLCVVARFFRVVEVPPRGFARALYIPILR